MSLLNDVLRDLQTRGAFGVEPLTGLQPVTEPPTQHRWRALILPALTALSMAAAIVLWRPVADGRWVPSFARIMVEADTQPPSKLQTVPKTSAQAEPHLAPPPMTLPQDEPYPGPAPMTLPQDEPYPGPAPMTSAPAEPYPAPTPMTSALALPYPGPGPGPTPMTSPQAEPDLAASGDNSGGVFPIYKTSESSPAPLDDVGVDTAADSPPQSKLQTVPKTPPKAGPDLAASGDNSGDVFPIYKTSTSGPAPLDDDVVDTATDSPPASAVSPATATMLRRETLDAATAAARPVTKGLTAMRGNDLLSAERLFREALTIDPGDGAVWGYLYSVLLRSSQRAAAEQALRRGLISATEPAPLAKLYARMLLDRGEKDAAVGILQTHRPVAASDTEYDAFLAALLQQLGQYAEAGEIYRKLLIVQPSSGSWWIGLAMSSDSIGNHPDALSAFQRALRTDALKTPLARYARRRTAELQAHD